MSTRTVYKFSRRRSPEWLVELVSTLQDEVDSELKRERRQLLEMGIVPGQLAYDEFICLYVTKQEEAHPKATKIARMPKAWALSDAVTERLTYEDGTMVEWDHPNKEWRLWDSKEKKELIHSRPLVEGERKPRGEEE